MILREDARSDSNRRERRNMAVGVQYLMQYLVGISRLPLPKSTATQDFFVLLL